MQNFSKIKLIVSEYYQYSLASSGNHEYANDLYREGIYIAPQPLSKFEVIEIDRACVEALDRYQNYIALESNGSDRRIYGIDRLIDAPVLTALGHQLAPLACKFYGTTKVNYFCMFGEIKATEQNCGSGSGWHRDSPFRHQFKCIVYLTDVTENNGPFEFIPRSHSYKAVSKVSRELKRNLNVDRFGVDEVERLLDCGVLEQVKTVTATAGTILYADTRGLHRGRPLSSGLRRAVTFYFYADKIPHHFVLAAGNTR